MTKTEVNGKLFHISNDLEIGIDVGLERLGHILGLLQDVLLSSDCNAYVQQWEGVVAAALCYKDEVRHDLKKIVDDVDAMRSVLSNEDGERGLDRAAQPEAPALRVAILDLTDRIQSPDKLERLYRLAQYLWEQEGSKEKSPAGLGGRGVERSKLAEDR